MKHHFNARNRASLRGLVDQLSTQPMGKILDQMTEANAACMQYIITDNDDAPVAAIVVIKGQVTPDYLKAIDAVQWAAPYADATEPEATCIGCGCTDSHACFDNKNNEPCHWERIDREARIGVCSWCLMEVGRWDAGDFTMHDAQVPA